MIKIKFNDQKIKIVGYIAFSIGILAFLEEHVFKFSSYSQSYNPGYGLAVCALIFLGMVSVAVAECLKNMEDRLNKLENSKLKS